MKKFIKIAIIFVGILIVFGVGFLSAIALSPQISEKIILLTAQNSLKDITIQKLTIKKQDIDLSGKISFKNIYIFLKQGNESFEIDIDEIAIADIIGILIAKKNIEVQLMGGSITSSMIKAAGVHVKLLGKGMESWSGSVDIEHVKISGFESEDLKIDVQASRKKVVLSNIKGRSYGGTFNAQANIDLVPQIQYAASISFDDFNALEMRKFNEVFFSQIKGNIFGKVEIEGNQNNLETMDVVAQFKGIGEIKSRLLAPLLSYVPKSIQRNMLDELIKNDENLHIDQGKLQLKNDNLQNIATSIDLYNKETNLKMNISVDIPVDKGPQSLLDYVVQIPNLKKGL